MSRSKHKRTCSEAQHHQLTKPRVCRLMHNDCIYSLEPTVQNTYIQLTIISDKNQF